MEKTKQPPSGGCVLKPRHADMLDDLRAAAAFGRLCVETAVFTTYGTQVLAQPPSGGCVLKPYINRCAFNSSCAAAFGRLCVETDTFIRRGGLSRAAAFGRLCVETSIRRARCCRLLQPPSGGCVLKLRLSLLDEMERLRSRLRAAVC